MKITKYICAVVLLTIQISSAMKSEYAGLDYSECKEVSCWQSFKLGCGITGNAVKKAGKFVGTVFDAATVWQAEANGFDLREEKKKNQ